MSRKEKHQIEEIKKQMNEIGSNTPPTIDHTNADGSPTKTTDTERLDRSIAGALTDISHLQQQNAALSTNLHNIKQQYDIFTAETTTMNMRLSSLITELGTTVEQQKAEITALKTRMTKVEKKK